MCRILIELDRTDAPMLQQLLHAVAQQVILVDTQRFDGALVVQILASLNAATIPLLAKIVIDRIQANRHIVIKKKGLTIVDLSADNAVKILTELSNDD